MGVAWRRVEPGWLILQGSCPWMSGFLPMQRGSSGNSSGACCGNSTGAVCRRPAGGLVGPALAGRVGVIGWQTLTAFCLLHQQWIHSRNAGVLKAANHRVCLADLARASAVRGLSCTLHRSAPSRAARCCCTADLHGYQWTCGVGGTSTTPSATSSLKACATRSPSSPASWRMRCSLRLAAPATCTCASLTRSNHPKPTFTPVNPCLPHVEGAGVGGHTERRGGLTE